MPGSPVLASNLGHQYGKTVTVIRHGRAGLRAVLGEEKVASVDRRVLVLSQNLLVASDRHQLEVV